MIGLLGIINCVNCPYTDTSCILPYFRRDERDFCPLEFFCGHLSLHVLLLLFLHLVISHACRYYVDMIYKS